LFPNRRSNDPHISALHSQTAAEAAENVDLDELFRDCYFGDFPVPPFATGPGGDDENMDGSGNKRSADDAGIDDDGDTKHLTDQQKIERRERNREHAKRSRLRKKFLLESLQEQIHGLQAEIETLKDIIKTELPEKSDAILKKLTGDREKFTPLPMPSGFGPVKTLMEPDFRLMSALSGSQQNFAISDPSLPDNPIVYVSQGFLDLTGYTLDQVLGRNCRFLQGPGTDQSAVEVIRRGIKEGVDTSVCLLNYKVDGTPFWNQFFVAALRDAENNVVNFVGVQCEVSKAVVEKQMSEGKTPASAFAKANAV
jgi:PAS domain S-box-containing protein